MDAVAAVAARSGADFAPYYDAFVPSVVQALQASAGQALLKGVSSDTHS